MIYIFILGRPGSGKSTAARILIEQAVDYDYWAYKIDEYKILNQWSKAEYKIDTQYKRFRRIEEYDAFEVRDPLVLDESLREVERRAWWIPLPFGKEWFVMIEFARDDYLNALQSFSPYLLQHAYYLFVDANVEVCKYRIHQRVDHPFSEDDHFVSDYVLQTFYRHPINPSISYSLEQVFGIDRQRVKYIDNSDLSLPQFFQEVRQFGESILRQEKVDRHTDPVQVASLCMVYDESPSI